MNRVIFVFGLLIIVLMLLPNELRNILLLEISHYAQVVFAWDINDTISHNWFSDKLPFVVTLSMLGHFVLFVSLTFLVVGLTKKISWLSLTLLLIFAAMTEFLQLLTASRHANLIDFGINSFAIILTIMLIEIKKMLERLFSTQ